MRAHECTVVVDAEGKVSLDCPGGGSWTYYKKGKEDGRDVCRFIVDGENEVCQRCRLRGRCVGLLKSGVKVFSVDERSVRHSTFITEHQKKLHSEKGKMMYSNRMPTVERVFGHLKENLKFRSFGRRGFALVKTEWSMVLTAVNIARLFMLSHPEEAAI